MCVHFTTLKIRVMTPLACLIVALPLLFQGADGTLIRRFNYDARLYEHFTFDSRYIQFSRTEPDDWKNISALVESKNISFNSMICTYGPGAWIFYPDEDFKVGTNNIYYLVVGEHCVRSDDIDSIQPLGKMDELLTEGVMLFPGATFEGSPTLVVKEPGSAAAMSLIFTGDQPYQFSGAGQKICILPGLTMSEYGYCLMSNLAMGFGMEGDVAVSNTCEDDAKKVVVHDCYTSGVHEIYTDSDFKISKLNEVCDGSGDDFDKAKFTLVMDMWGRRMGDDLSLRPFDTRPEDQIKLKIIWTILELFKNSCPAADPMYVFLLGHLFVNHMKHLWASGNETVLDDSVWKNTDSFVEFCQGHMGEVPVISGKCKTDDQFHRIPGADSPMSESWFEIANGDAFDPIIEQMWLIINFVVPSCSHIAGYVTNDWSDVVLFFNQAFMDPLQNLWAEPGDWLRVYPMIFHGWDMREEHQDIVECLEGALAQTPEFDPIGRPKSFRDLITYKHSLPAHGKVTPDERRKRENSPDFGAGFARRVIPRSGDFAQGDQMRHQFSSIDID